MERLNDFGKRLKFSFKLLVRPFKGFDSVKDRENISFALVTFFYVFFGIMGIIEYQYTGFIFNDNNIYEFNAITILITSIVPLLLLVVSNYLITTFLNGKGNFKDIYLAVGYSLLPLLIFRIIGVVVTHFITFDDYTMLTTILGLGMVWTLFLAFVGMTVVHEYGMFENVLNIILTLVAFLVLIFLILLLFNLSQNVLGFLDSLIKEIVYKLRRRNIWSKFLILLKRI